MNKLISLALSLLIISSFGCTETQSTIIVENLRVILPPSVARTTSIYGTIKNTANYDDTLLKITTNAGSVMLHQTVIRSGRAKMNHTGKYTIKAGQSLILKPMSYHIMLMGINHKIIKENNKIDLILTFKKAGEIKLKVPVVKG